MNFMRKFANNFWEKDPGLLRSKRAFKTILACFIAVLLSFMFHDRVSAIAAGVVAGFSLQGIPGATRRQQMRSMLVIGLALVLSFTIANILHPYPLGISLLLIIVSFLCFYLRRFGAIFNIFAISVWATCFVGTVMPTETLSAALQHGLAALMGFTIAFIINFTLFPENRISSFLANLKTYFTHCSLHLQWLAVHISKTTDAEIIKQKMLDNFQDRRHLILFNQTILESFIRPQKKLLKKLNNYFITMYTIGKALSILNDSCYQIALSKIKLAEEVQQQLIITFNYFAEFLQNIEIENTSQTISLKQKPEAYFSYLQQFKETLLCYDLDDNSAQLLTIQLGLQQLWQNLHKL